MRNPTRRERGMTVDFNGRRVGLVTYLLSAIPPLDLSICPPRNPN